MFYFQLKIINKIRGSELRHRQFKLLTEELDTKFKDINYFKDVRWLSCSQVLNRFCELLDPIQQFLDEQGLLENFNVISTFEWKQQLYFLADITKHLNELNLKLQGKGKFIWDLAKLVQEFSLKLIAFRNQIIENDYSFFPTLQQNEPNSKADASIEGENDSYDTNLFIQFIDVLIEEFDARFSDFKKFSLAFKFLKNPFIFDEEETQNLADIFNTKKSHLEFDISLIKEETYLANENSGDLWKRLLSNCDFMALKSIVPNYLSMFGSTYNCESSFSSLSLRKSNFRSSLSQENLESEMRCELTKSKPDLTKLITEKQCQLSH